MIQYYGLGEDVKLEPLKLEIVLMRVFVTDMVNQAIMNMVSLAEALHVKVFRGLV